MKYDLDKSMEILNKTFCIVRQVLQGLRPDCLMNKEGPDSFSPFDGRQVAGKTIPVRD